MSKPWNLVQMGRMTETSAPPFGDAGMPNGKGLSLFVQLLTFGVLLMGLLELRQSFASLIDRHPYLMMGLVAMLVGCGTLQLLWGQTRWLTNTVLAIGSFTIITVGAICTIKTGIDVSYNWVGSPIAWFIRALPWWENVSNMGFSAKAVSSVAVLLVLAGWAMLFPKALRAILALLVVLLLLLGTTLSIGDFIKELLHVSLVIVASELAIAGIFMAYLSDRHLRPC